MIPSRGYESIVQPSHPLYDGVSRRLIMEKEITITEFAEELRTRLEDGKTVDCCKTELLRLADLITDKIGDEKILVSWQD